MSVSACAYVLAYARACVCLLLETLIPMRACVRACGQVCHMAGLVGYGLVMLDFFKVLEGIKYTCL